ncbi:fgfr1 oncogene partner [Plakobranchus ocellatus]|uniref:Centrosomal protein 43 n=1 Tax=Plakobranchus ocellatus TaxID=259542 RepID=A0AAV4AA54_9GAST|nr:fgfr1 oncogene partner [Plakobranchus ocellatus]
MSADEDTELRDLVAQTLESNGTLGKLRAQLRASVFLALEDQENGQSKTPFLNKELRGFLSTQEGRLTASLVQEFLEFFNLEFTLAVFKPESGVGEKEKRSELLKQLAIPTPTAPANAPLLTTLLHSKNSVSSEGTSSLGSGDGVHLAKDLTKKQIADAQAKFDYYDKDNSGAIDKDELRELFMDMFPNFHRNMLERYVNDEFNAVDKDFSSSIDFEEFLGMYKRLFLCCRSVVAGDVEELVSPSFQQHKSDSKNSAAEKQHHHDDGQVLSGKSSPDKSDSQKNSHPPKVNSAAPKDDGSDIEEDPFFDDAPAAAVNFNTLSSVPSHSVTSATRKANPYSRPSQIPRYQQRR